jgi:hypothetical protein
MCHASTFYMRTMNPSTMRASRIGPKRTNYVILVLIVLACFSQSCMAKQLGFYVKTDTGTFIIDQPSQDIAFQSSGQIIGTVESLRVTPQGRELSGYYSKYANIGENDVIHRERTNAKNGSLRAAETMRLYALTDDVPEVKIHVISVNKSYETITIEHNTHWPVSFSSDRVLYYSGKGINDVDFVGNNWDYIGTSSLYNSELQEERSYRMVLNHSNITIKSFQWGNDSYMQAVDWLPSRQTLYKDHIKSTGITDFKYGQAGSDQLSTIKSWHRITYDNLGEQRYNGAFNSSLEMNMTTWQPLLPPNWEYRYNWLGCPCETYGELPYYELSPINGTIGLY